jgi:hypothetical protein
MQEEVTASHKKSQRSKEEQEEIAPAIQGTPRKYTVFLFYFLL